MAEDSTFPDEATPPVEDIPPALQIAEADRGTCSSCGNPTYRPEGKTPTGRKPRIPKYCETCKTVKGPSKGTAGRTRKRSTVDIQAGMTELYTTLGLMVAVKDPELGTLIVGQRRLKKMLETPAEDFSIAEDAGKAWGDVAAVHPNVEQTLQRMLATGVWAELANAHAPLAALAIQRKPRLLTRLRGWFGRRWGRNGSQRE